MAINNSQKQNKEVKEKKGVFCLLCKKKSKIGIYEGQELKNEPSGVVLTYKGNMPIIISCPHCGKKKGLRLTKK